MILTQTSNLDDLSTFDVVINLDQHLKSSQLQVLKNQSIYVDLYSKQDSEDLLKIAGFENVMGIAVKTS